MSDFKTPSGDTLNEIRFKNSSNIDFTAPAVKVDGVKMYYSSSGVVQVRDSSNTDSILWQNGHWTNVGKEKVPPATRIAIRSDVNKGTVEAFKAGGGNANGYVLPSFIIDNSQGVNNTLSDQELADLGVIVPNVSSSVDTDTTNSNNTASSIQPSDWEFKGSNVTKHTIRVLMQNGPLNYPIDALYHATSRSSVNQDHVRILQYTYKPPKASLVTGGSAKNTLLKGLPRQSPLKEYLGMVKLPMPQGGVADSNQVNWGEDKMNNLAAAMTTGVVGDMTGTAIGAAAGGAIAGGVGAQLGILAKIAQNEGAFKGLDPTNLEESWKKLKGGAESIMGGQAGMIVRGSVASRILAMAGVQVSANSILGRGAGIAPQSNLELLFQSPALRTFTFDWKMTPRSEEEARIIRNIIRFFKQGMAARKTEGRAGGASLYLGTPNVFQVQYKTNQNEDMEGVNRIKTCACTGTAVNYTPDGIWSAYERGQPVSTVLSLRMAELEPIYDTDYQETIESGREWSEPGWSGEKADGDLYPITINEVGY